MAKIKLYSALTLVVLMLIVVLQNTDPVATRFLWITFIMPRALLLALTLLIGIAVGMLLALGTSSRRNKKQ
jgi:putative membrane protein